MGFSLTDVVTRSEPAFPPVDWEEIACPLCGGTDTSHKLEAPEPAGNPGRWFLVVECRHCGLCYTNPRPSADCLARLFPPPLITSSTCRPPRSDDIALLLERGCVLDLGNGVGSFLHRLHAHGRPFAAVNLSSDAAAFLRSAWGITAYAGTLPHPELVGQCFDVITCFDALAQIPQPLALLQAARQALAPGGILITAVPNLDSLPFHWFGADWPGLNLPRHLTHFTPRTLRLMLHQAGFRLHRLTPLRHTGWLRHGPRAGGWTGLLRNKTAASMAGWYTALLRRANGMLAIAMR